MFRETISNVRLFDFHGFIKGMFTCLFSIVAMVWFKKVTEHNRYSFDLNQMQQHKFQKKILNTNQTRNLKISGHFKDNRIS